MGLSVKIGGQRVNFFNNFELELNHNAIASDFSFSFFFDPNNPLHRKIAKPFSYQKIEVFFNGSLLITGTLLNLQFAQSAVPDLVTLKGQSLTGVLVESNIPVDVYPLQSIGLSLDQITRKLLNPFGLIYVVDPSVSARMSKPFSNSIAAEGQTVGGYLVELARQKDIVITHDAEGRLVFTNAKTDAKPIFDFDLTKNTPDGYSFSIDYPGTSMFSPTVAQKQQSTSGGNAGKSTVENKFVPKGVIRARVVSQTSGDDNDTQLVAKRDVSNQYGSISLSINISSFMAGEKVIQPNNTINILAPKLAIYDKTKFFIQSVSFTGNALSNTSTIKCVLPESYTTQTPKIKWS
jgi:prophage tail gpP-like protein